MGVALALAAGTAVGAGLPTTDSGPAPVSAAVAVAPTGVTARAVDPAAPTQGVEASSDAAHPLLALGLLAALASEPLTGVSALPPTPLEQQEPERLYALVTRDRPVDPLRYVPDDLEPLPGDIYQARAEVVDRATALIDAAAEEGHLLVVTSGFRDHDTQAGTHEDWVRRSGAAAADRLSARPGHSEHQLGLAVDLAGTCAYQCFGDTDEGRWVAQNAHRWGFIVRYPEGGEEVTGYAAEPWHLRYVGPRAAWAMYLRGEPYWETLAPLLLDSD